MLPGDDGLISPMLQNQYDVLYGSWPKNYDEVVLVMAFIISYMMVLP